MKVPMIAQDKEHLKELIETEMNLNGNQCDLNHIDTSLITNMTALFNKSDFRGDMSKWDVSNVQNMCYMFKDSQFNGDIRNWDVSNAKNMSYMFYQSQFNKDISMWKIDSVTDMNGIFRKCNNEKPWWAIEDNEKRKYVIEKYKLMQKLDNQLTKKEIVKPKKNKI